MGALASRQLPGAEEADVLSTHAYKYPPRSGHYFGTHFIMGGERFDTPQPEAYLFGENTDLNFLGSRPTPFPYPPPQSNEPTKTLKSLVNIRKESLRFIRCPDAASKLADSEPENGNKASLYNIEFTFDCDARCAITIYYFCTEEVASTGVVYYPRDAQMNSQTFHYKKGANQQFCQTSHMFDPTKYPEEDLSYNAEKEIIPVVIHCVVEEGTEEMRQSHTTMGAVEKHSDGTYVLKALKQKLFVDGLSYLLQEIYGIENKNIDAKPGSDEETEDGGSECVICMCDVRDTLILPCRHLCLCNSCADSLRYQANNCPICRAPFRALLQIRALQKTSGVPTLLPPSPPDGSMENIPPGYEPVSLIEALNGPSLTRVNLAPPTPQPPHPSIASPDTDSNSQAAEVLNRCNLERSSSTSLGGGKKHSKGVAPKDTEGKSPRDRSLAQPSAPEFRMSVLLAREEENKNASDKMAANSPLLFNHRAQRVNGVEISKKHISSPEADYTVEDLEADADTLDGEGELEGEGDSEAERLSPLLTNKMANGVVKSNGPISSARNHGSTATLNGVAASPVDKSPAPVLHLDAPALQHIDDTDTDEPELSTASVGALACRSELDSPAIAEDSDYFTPEDTNTTILTVPKNPQKHDILANNMNSSAESTPQRWPLPHHVTSLPGTPLSHTSVRSSADSYSSSSSTRQLLGTPAIPPAVALTANTQC